MNSTTFDSLTIKKAPLERVSSIFPWAVGLICITPFLLNMLGVDFSSHSVPVPADGGNQNIDVYFYRLSGAFTHTILEWSAVMIAVCVAMLALVHYRIVNDATTLVIGIALLASGCMDAFHTLAADRLIEAVVDNRELMPFTWAIARVFEAIILMLGVGLFLNAPKTSDTGNTGIKQQFRLVLVVCVAIVGIAYGLIYYCSTANSLPRTLFPDFIITRPWDVAPLALFVFAGLFLFPRYYRQHPSLFSLSLLVSMIPQIILELHMVFGSSALFDNHFNIAHFLKIIAYLVPFIGMVMDYSFSHQKQSDLLKTLTRTKAHAQAVLEVAVDGIITIDRFGCIRSVNPEVTKLFGYEAEELIGQNFKILMSELYQDELDAYLSNSAETAEKKIIGIGREIKGKRKDATEFSMELAVAEVKGYDKLMFTGFIRDISERKQFESQLKEREELFSTFVNSAPTLMWMSDADDKLVMFNDGWLAFFGTDLQDDISKPWQGQSIHKDFRDTCLHTYKTKMAAQEPFDQEYKMSDKTGKNFWFREIGVPRFQQGKFQGYIANLIDISDRKLAEKELRNSVDDLKKSNEELELFAYVASHDLQEPLRMVASYTQLLGRRYKGKLDDDADEFIEYAVDGAKRMQGLIQALLEYSRVDSMGKPLSRVDSGKVLEGAIANLSIATAEADMQLTFDEMPMVMADEHQLMQLLQNLIGNAVKYSAPQKSGTIHIGVKSNDKQWVFSVRDNGIGIEPQFFDRIFVIFKRLHSAEEKPGTGIGLSVCKKIVERHGGKIWVESEPGEGSVFSFSLQGVDKLDSSNSETKVESDDMTV